jgi:predicted anti-sigma-YlaC factor YlaD
MKCKEVQNRIDFALTGQGVEIPEEFRSHLETCGACSAYLEQIEELAAALESQAEITLSPEEELLLHQEIDRQIDASEAEHQERTLRWVRWIPRIAIPAVAAAALILTIFIPQKSPVTEVLNLTDDELALVYYNLGDIGDDALVQKAAFTQIAQEIDPLDAEDVLEGASDEEIRWLMNNLSMESY